MNNSVDYYVYTMKPDLYMERETFLNELRDRLKFEEVIEVPYKINFLMRIPSQISVRGKENLSQFDEHFSTYYNLHHRVVGNPYNLEKEEDITIKIQDMKNALSMYIIRNLERLEKERKEFITHD